MSACTSVRPCNAGYPERGAEGAPAGSDRGNPQHCGSELPAASAGAAGELGVSASGQCHCGKCTTVLVLGTSQAKSGYSDLVCEAPL